MSWAALHVIRTAYGARHEALHCALLVSMDARKWRCRIGLPGALETRVRELDVRRERIVRRK